MIFPFVLYCGLAAIFSTQGGQLPHILCCLMSLSSFIFLDLGLICGFYLWRLPLDVFKCLFIHWGKRLVWFICYYPYNGNVILMATERGTKDWGKYEFHPMGDWHALLGINCLYHISIKVLDCSCIVFVCIKVFEKYFSERDIIRWVWY